MALLLDASFFKYSLCSFSMSWSLRKVVGRERVFIVTNIALLLDSVAMLDPCTPGIDHAPPKPISYVNPGDLPSRVISTDEAYGQ